MIKRIRRFFQYHTGALGVILILTAAVLLELISAIQYSYSHRLLEDALEKRAESELTMKAILVKSTLRSIENTVKNHVWDMKRNINEPDSMYDVARWLIHDNKEIIGGGIAFAPGRFPSKGRLFEPWAYKHGESIVVDQIAGPSHDYTQMEFFTETFDKDTCHWSDPYLDEAGTGQMISSYALTLHHNGEKVGVMGVDMSLTWLGDTLNARHIYPSSFVILLAKNGTLISGPSSNHPKYSDLKQVMEIVNHNVYSRRSEQKHCKIAAFKGTDGEKGEIIYCHLRGHPRWQMAVVCYDNEVYGDLKKMRIHIFGLGLLGLLLLGFILHRYNKNNKRLIVAASENQRIESELLIARNIQQEMLPRSASVISHRYISVEGFLEPAREVGGDLYDYLIRDEKLFFCIGDVSGKGVPSALLMAVVHSLFRTEAARENNPKTIMESINRYSTQGNESSMFVTMFIGVLDLPSGRLRYCNAGHDAPYIIAPDGPHAMPVISNLPIAVMPDYDYVAQEQLINPGESLVLYTDGLTEARNTERELFSARRVEEVLSRCADDITTSNIINHVEDAVITYANGAEQSDDLTLLVISYHPPVEQYIFDKTLTLRNEISEVKALGTFIKDVTGSLNLDKSVSHDVKLAVEEAVVNVIDYAYPIGTEGDINVNARADGHSLRIVITDTGAAFDPTEALKADTSLSVEDRPIGGLGIFLVRQLMDAINYERVDGHNILTLIKNYKKQ